MIVAKFARYKASTLKTNEQQHLWGISISKFLKQMQYANSCQDLALAAEFRSWHWLKLDFSFHFHPLCINTECLFRNITRNIMSFQEYIILIQDFNNYTVFMHNTFCSLSTAFWTLIQNTRSSGIGWLTWNPSWWTAMTWWCQRSSSSIFTRLALPLLPLPSYRRSD